MSDIDISGSFLFIDISCNSTVWYSLDISFIPIDVSYVLEKQRMVLFSHESYVYSLGNGNDS